MQAIKKKKQVNMQAIKKKTPTLRISSTDIVIFGSFPKFFQYEF